MNTTAKPTRSELDDYFDSIESVLSKALRPNRLSEILLFLKIMSPLFVLPVIWPIPSFVVRGRDFHSLFTFVESQRYFFLWWGISLLLFLGIFYVVKKFEQQYRSNRDRLSLVQMSFGLCYRLVKNLRSYQLNGLVQFYEAAVGDWKLLLTGIEYIFSYSELVKPLRYPWFKVDPETAQIMRGIAGIFTDLEPRINNKKQLAPVADSLELLACYLYSSIGASKAVDKLEDTSALKAFAEAIISLPPFESLTEEPTSRQATAFERLRARLRSLSSVFASENMVVCFLSWWLLCSVLVLIGAKIAFKIIPELKMDSVLVTCLIATPIGAAVGVVAVAAAHRSLAKTLRKNSLD